MTKSQKELLKARAQGLCEVIRDDFLCSRPVVGVAQYKGTEIKVCRKCLKILRRAASPPKSMWPQKRWPIVREHDELPYYVQALIWCWHKPIWIGLPLAAPLSLGGLAVDIITGIPLGCYLMITHWGKK